MKNSFQLPQKQLQTGKIVAWFQGKSETGPRALGNRSILANPCLTWMKEHINDRVKHREAFRPFAPSVLEEQAADWFAIDRPAPYMILNARVKRPEALPAVTHVDGSARIQTVTLGGNERYYRLIAAVAQRTGVPVVLNTSFNDNEAIVETPKDAVATFSRTNIDVLFLGNWQVTK